MSEWYEAGKDDIDVDKKEKEVNIYVKQNDFGSVYVTLTFKQVMAMAEEIIKNK